MTRSAARFAQMTLYHFRELYRNKVALFFNLLFPLLLIVVFGTLLNPSERAAVTSVGLVDEDGGPLAAAFVDALTDSGLYTLQTGSAEELAEELRAGRLRSVLVVPPGIDEAVVAASGGTGGPAEVGVLHDPLSPASIRTATELGVLLNALGVRMTGVQPAFVASLRTLPGAARRDVFDYLMPGMMVVMLLASGLMTVSVTVAEQRSSGALRHLFSTPLPMGVWLTGRVAANLLMAGVQGGLLFAFAGLVFDVSPPANVWGTVVVVALSSLTILGIGLLIGAHAKNEDTAVALSMPVMMVLMFLGNAAVPLEDPPDFIAGLLRWMPTFHMTEAMRAVMRHGHGLTSVGGQLALLAGLAAGLFGVVLLRLRRQYVLVAE